MKRIGCYSKQELQKKEFMHRQALLSADQEAIERINTTDDQASESAKENSAQITSNEETNEEDQEELHVAAPLKEVKTPAVLPPKPMDSPFMKQVLPYPNEDSSEDLPVLESNGKRTSEAGSFKEKVKAIKARVGSVKKTPKKLDQQRNVQKKYKESESVDEEDAVAETDPAVDPFVK